MEYHFTLPLREEDIAVLRAGDVVYLSGIIYTARDAAHKRMYDALRAGQPLPLDIRDAVIYYMGPSPAREGRPIGSAGPTTASRMDKYAPELLDLELKAMIGKGRRSEQVREAIIRNRCIYCIWKDHIIGISSHPYSWRQSIGGTPKVPGCHRDQSIHRS